MGFLFTIFDILMDILYYGKAFMSLIFGEMDFGDYLVLFGIPLTILVWWRLKKRIGLKINIADEDIRH